jgi:hypothetical protein
MNSKKVSRLLAAHHYVIIDTLVIRVLMVLINIVERVGDAINIVERVGDSGFPRRRRGSMWVTG